MGFKFNLKQRMGKGLAKQIAKRISGEDFLRQLEEAWLMVLEKRKGAVDIDEEVKEMRERIKKSGYGDVFKNANVTEQDLIDTLRSAVEKAGKSIK